MIKSGKNTIRGSTPYLVPKLWRKEKELFTRKMLIKTLMLILTLTLHNNTPKEVKEMEEHMVMDNTRVLTNNNNLKGHMKPCLKSKEFSLLYGLYL
jgi:hypothetical protein